MNSRAIFHWCCGSILLLLLILPVLLSLPEQAAAIPAFARKYKTSCTTCHTAFPKLNPFGRAFRNLGYQMPGGDEQYIKDKQLALGAEAWKHAFPDGVWPGNIPGTPPLAVRISGAYVLNTQNKVEQDFKIPAGLNIIAAGTMSEDITFFAGIHLFDEGAIGFLNRAYIQFDNLLDRWFPDYGLNIRIGQFLPDFMPFVIHRGLMKTPYITNAVGYGGVLGGHHGGIGIMEQAQRGIEAKGILNHRIQYVAGLVNGNGIPAAGEEEGNFDDNNRKDIYARLAYKFGGIGLDGYDPQASEGVLQETENWIDNSLRIGLFGYKGYAKPLVEEAHEEGGMQMEEMETPTDFFRIGFDVDAYWGDLNLFGVFMTAEEEMDEGDKVKYSAWFIEADYVYYPWLLPGLRYEMIDPETGSSTTRVVPNITALIRANIKVIAEMRIDPDDFDSDHIDLSVGLDFAF